MAQVNRSFEFGDPPGGGHREWHRLMQNEGYDLSKFELVAVPEEFSDASGTDQLGHGGLLEYDGVLDVEGTDSDESSVDPLDGFNVTIEHVGDDLGEGSGLVHLLEVPSHLSETRQYHKDDILDVGIEACDLKSLLEQFEESEQPQPDMKQVAAPQPELSPVPQPVPRPVPPPTPLPAPKEPTRYKIMTPMKELPNPADIVKKIAPVKRKAAIMIDPDALPFKRTKPKPTSQNPEVNKAINLARSTHAASPIPFNLKNLIPAPKYLSMEHDYCMSPAPSEKSSASDLSNQMSKEQRRAYYKYKYRVKKKFDGVDSPSKCSSVSSSPFSLSPASMSPNPAIIEVSNGKVPIASMPNPAAVVPLFDKIPGYFSKKLLVGMYREIDSSAPSKPVHQGYDQNIFVNSENNNEGGRKHDPQSPTERNSRPQIRRRHRRSYRQSRRKNSLSSQSDSSYCSSCSERSCYPEENEVESETQSRHPNRHVRRRQRTRDSICSARSRSCDSRSPSHSRSRSPSYSSYSDCDSIGRSRSFSRSRSRSFSRSRSRSFSRSPSYPRSRSRSRSYSRSRSRSPSIDYSRRSRSYSRSMSRSPHRTNRSSSRRLSRSSRSRSRGRSMSMSRGRHHSRSRDNNNRSESSIRTFDPMGDSKEVKYTDEQLQEFEERRVVYVGNIERDVTRPEIMRQFSRFGIVDKIQLYFRDDQDSYGFVTYRYKCDAVAAIKSGHDPNWPKYELCFGGRRKFCMNKYQDLDSLNRASTDLDFGYSGDEERIEVGPEEPEESEFDKLLKAAMKKKSSKR